MGRTIVHTLCFNTPEMVEGALQCHYHGEYERYLIDCGFPGVDSEVWKNLAWKYRCIYLKIDNGGVSENWNTVARILNVSDHDVLIGLDPDERPKQTGWIEAIASVMKADPTIGYITTNKIGYEPEGNINDYVDLNIAGVAVREYNSLVAWILGGFSGRCLNAIRGLAQENKYYGYLEHETLRRMKNHGFRWLMLRDYYAEHLASGEKLMEWKNLNRDRNMQMSFEEWADGN